MTNDTTAKALEVWRTFVQYALAPVSLAIQTSSPEMHKGEESEAYPLPPFIQTINRPLLGLDPNQCMRSGHVNTPTVIMGCS